MFLNSNTKSVHIVLKRNKQDNEKSFKIFHEMTQKFPKEKQAYWQTGLYYHFNNSYPEAIKEFKKALELDPTWDRALNLLGYSYAYIGDFTNAIIEILKNEQIKNREIMTRMSRHMNPAIQLHAPQGSGKGKGISTLNVIRVM